MTSAIPNTTVMHPVQLTELRELILPVLACLPTAFFSPSPPPALLPLLSPILRQRVHLLASSATASTEPSSQGSWLRLLTWSSERAERLVDIVSRLQLEPHPVSGELELFGDTTDPDAGKVWYRRLDEETVQARCDAKEYDVGFVYVWSSNDTGGVGLESTANSGAQDGWKVAEVVPLEGDENLELEGWHEDLAEAESSGGRGMQNTINGRTAAQVNDSTMSSATTGADDDDDDYWAAYDRTPGKSTPAPARTTNVSSNRGLSEQNYFERYGEVQPAMDAHDPDEEAGAEELGVSTQRQHLNAIPGQPHDRNGDESNINPEVFRSLNDAIEHQAQNTDMAMPVGQRVTTLTQPHDAQEPPSPAVASLERSASEGSPAAEISVKHHISHEIKSLFRLSQGVGIERDEFSALVQRELEVLGRIEL